MGKIKSFFFFIEEELHEEIKPMTWMGYIILISVSAFIIWLVSMIHSMP